MRQKIHDIVHKYVHREGIDDMLKWYDNNGFYDAWASTTFHCNYVGGLAEHTYNVITNALKLADVLESEVSRVSIVLCALLHDAGKCHDGFFENSNREYMLSLDELLYIVHSADLYAARFMEPVKDYKGGEKIDL